MTKAERLKRYASSFLAFANDLHIPIAGKPERFGDTMADFQLRDFESLAPSLHTLAAGEEPPVRRFWLERTKGASKDTDVSVALLWLLAFSHRPLRIQIGANDAQQADEIRLIIKQILQIEAPLNQVLYEVVQIQNTRIVAHGSARRGSGTKTNRPESIAEILTSDAKGSHGSRPDVVIVNELSHIVNREFSETLADNADKVPGGLVIVATNAGFNTLWQYDWREIARESDRWHFSVRDTPAPWISERDLEESRRRNPAARYNRLWRGVWVSGAGDAIPPEDIDAACCLEGPMVGYDPAFDPYIGALDLGLKHDHSALVVLGIHWQSRRYRLAECLSWAPPVRGGSVRLEEVQAAVLNAWQRFDLRFVVFDPWQARLMAEQLAAQGVAMIEFPFTSKNLDVMATKILQVFRNRQLDLYHDRALIRDLSKLSITETQRGFKLTATRDEHGHADRATALAMALPAAEELGEGYRRPRRPGVEFSQIYV